MENSRESKPILGNNLCTQIGILVNDIEKAAADYAKFFGVPVPPISITDEVDKSNTHYLGKPTPARTKQAFFDIGPNIQIELLQPDEKESTWRADLDSRGEGVHHIAFQIDGMDKMIDVCEENGMKLVQRGKWDTGHYAYIDANDTLKLTLELLENGKFDI